MNPPASPLAAPSALAPLAHPVFRMLWIAWLIANTCMWMNDVAAAWLMTSLTTSPVMVALVQTASTLPVLLLGLPSGALGQKHIGLYVYRRDFLLRFAALAPTPLEQAEQLEQLRALEWGFRIKVTEVTAASIEVDTPRDLERARAQLAASR